jgi:hypothetical protein
MTANALIITIALLLALVFWLMGELTAPFAPLSFARSTKSGAGPIVCGPRKS